MGNATSTVVNQTDRRMAVITFNMGDVLYKTYNTLYILEPGDSQEVEANPDAIGLKVGIVYGTDDKTKELLYQRFVCKLKSTLSVSGVDGPDISFFGDDIQKQGGGKVKESDPIPFQMAADAVANKKSSVGVNAKYEKDTGGNQKKGPGANANGATGPGASNGSGGVSAPPKKSAPSNNNPPNKESAEVKSSHSPATTPVRQSGAGESSTGTRGKNDFSDFTASLAAFKEKAKAKIDALPGALADAPRNVIGAVTGATQREKEEREREERERKEAEEAFLKEQEARKAKEKFDEELRRRKEEERLKKEAEEERRRIEEEMQEQERLEREAEEERRRLEEEEKKKKKGIFGSAMFGSKAKEKAAASDVNSPTGKKETSTTATPPPPAADLPPPPAAASTTQSSSSHSAPPTISTTSIPPPATYSSTNEEVDYGDSPSLSNADTEDVTDAAEGKLVPKKKKKKKKKKKVVEEEEEPEVVAAGCTACIVM